LEVGANLNDRNGNVSIDSHLLDLLLENGS